MRPIKFRGRRIDNGEYVYGVYVKSVPMSSFPGIVDNDDYIHDVDPDSVAQLIGYDVNGKEIYEGDTLIDGFGKEFKVVWEPNFCKTSILKEQPS